MAPEEKPSFYLYSIGYSPKIITLGTLVYNNYGMPEGRRATFPMSEAEFKNLEEQGEILSTEVSGCFTYNKDSKYGLGFGVAELADMDFEYAKKCQKIVEAKVGKRVVLNDPDDFFTKVLQQPETLKKLTSWLTVAKSEWLFSQVTFRRPRVYCCTGFYELSQTTARITNAGEFTAELSVSPEVIAIASGVPIGGKIGPFANGKSLESNFSAPQPGIWAARYHRLKVEYLQLATQGTTQPPQSITLKPDCTHPRNGLMGKDAAVVEKTRIVETADEIRNARGAVVTLEDATEIADETQDKKYWQAFQEAEERLEPRHDAELDGDEGADSTDDEG
ncbi:hypothetical protein SVAN01_10358 [Stagonosporopsis vannaccii]|nr:hypothetical protein SVAN01_10358 [Stagonosporopsis vannaccii]